MANINIALQSLKCNAETPKEIDADEPYLLVTIVDLAPFGYEVVKYGSWAGVKSGDHCTTFERPPGWSDAMWQGMAASKVLRIRFWGIDGKPKAISKPDNVIIVVSLVEHDDGNMDATRTLVKGTVSASLGGSMSLSKSERASRLIADIGGAIVIPTGFPNMDDPIRTRELTLTSDDLSGSPNTSRTKDLVLNGIGARYTATFQFDYT